MTSPRTDLSELREIAEEAKEGGYTYARIMPDDILALLDRLAAVPSEAVTPLDLRARLSRMAALWEQGAGSDPHHKDMAKVWRQCAYELREELGVPSEAVTPLDPELDVNRLATAILRWTGATPLNPTVTFTASPREVAEAIAREYASLPTDRPSEDAS